MVKAGLMRRAKGGVKLLGGGELKSKVDFAVFGASKSAIEAVEKAGGSVKIVKPKVEVSDEEPRGKNKRKAAADAADFAESSPEPALHELYTDVLVETY